MVNLVVNQQELYKLFAMKQEKFDAIFQHLRGNKSIGSRFNVSRDVQHYTLPPTEQHREPLYIFDIRNGAKVYSDESLREIVMKEHVDNGHMSFVPLFHRFKDELNISASRRFIQGIVSTCRTCKMTTGRKPTTVAIIPLPVEHDVFERVQIDLIELTGQPSSIGHRYIMTVLDCFTKYLWTFPMTSKDAVETTFHLDLWIKQHGVPRILQSDNGKEFKNEDMYSLFEETEMTVVHGRERHPRSQGKVEAVNKSLKAILTKLMQDTGEEWLYLLTDATAYYNNRRHYSTEMTPYEALYGRKKRTKGEDDTPRGRKRISTTEQNEELAREDKAIRLHKLRRSVQESLEKARKRMIRRGNVNIPKFSRGDVVTQFIPALDRGKAMGISSIPAKVFEVMKNDTYRLMYRDGSLSQRAAHISTLQLVGTEHWPLEWSSLEEARESTKKPVRTAVKLYQ